MICLPDFNGLHFFDKDFHASSWTKVINDFMFYRLPDYFKRNDSYKDSQQRGILERYMYIFGTEVDQDIIPYIECIQHTMNPESTDEKFLPVIAESLGAPVNLFINNDQYRNLLKFMIRYYNLKGTTPYIKRYFDILGFDITVDIQEIDITAYYYDTELIYDDGDIYDSLICPICFNYEAELTVNDNYIGDLPLTSEQGETLEKILTLQQPINSNLTQFNII